MNPFSYLKHTFYVLLDFIFPPSPEVLELQSLPLESFKDFAKPLSSPHPWIHPLFSYKELLIKEIVWQIKYKQNSILTEKIGLILAEHIESFIEEKHEFDPQRTYILIPIPLSKQRFRERGYNQSEEIARAICKYTKQVVLKTNILSRTKHNDSQTKTHSRNERLQKIKDSFLLSNPEMIKNSHVILIDDVTTTGATLTEARKEILKGKPKEVTAFTIAH